MRGVRHGFTILRAGDHAIEDVGSQATVSRHPCRHMQAFLTAALQQEDDGTR